MNPPIVSVSRICDGEPCAHSLAYPPEIYMAAGEDYKSMLKQYSRLTKVAILTSAEKRSFSPPRRSWRNDYHAWSINTSGMSSWNSFDKPPMAP